MSEPNKTGLAAAVLGGYVLGRNKKGRMALTATALLLGRALNPREVVAGGIRKIGGVPGGGEGGEQAQIDIAQAGRAAVSAIVNRRVTALTDALHERTLGLSGETDKDAAEDTDGEPEEGREEEGGDEGEERERDEREKEEAEEEEDEAAEDRSDTPRPQRARTRDSDTGEAKSAAGQNTPGRKPATRKGSEKKSPPDRKTSARRSTSTKKPVSRMQHER
ncbi:histone protein [Streptomyces sp.]|uniref:histone protein n=1 Tax=Streptomyces sp. TaxID=1931 RepID=UPI002F3F8DF8